MFKRCSFALNEDCGLSLPEQTVVHRIPEVEEIRRPAAAIEQALDHPIGSKRIDRIVSSKDRPASELTACIVVSDTTRPVPYRGDSGILMPVVRRLLACGMKNDHIVVLIATGTHRPLEIEEIRNWLDPEFFALGIRVLNHDCTDDAQLTDFGVTGRGSRIRVNSIYASSDIKILTGLVEGHFMAGFSGGRKSVCPGLIGRESTYIFHGYAMLSDPKAVSLNIDGNPCHEEALEMARKAGVDAIINVTLDHRLRLTGVFYGDLELAHQAAIDHLRTYTQIEVQETYDVVVVHAGFVGVNHYQCAKAAVEAAKVCRPDGHILLLAKITDTEHIGGHHYKSLLGLLGCIGPAAFRKLLTSPDWTFVPEQWQVQKWADVFDRVGPDRFLFYSPRFTDREYDFIPERRMSDDPSGDFQRAVEDGLAAVSRRTGKSIDQLSIAYLADGPYGVIVGSAQGTA